MTDTAADNLTGERIQQLLDAVGVESIEDAKQNVEAFEHDWRQPRYFSRPQIKELKIFAENVADAASEQFTQFYQSDFQVTADSTSQHFANEFTRQTPDNENPDFFLLFSAASERTPPDATPWGLIAIPHKTALEWVMQSLGDNNSDDDSARSLSQLETSLLLDIAALFVEAISSSYANETFNVIDAIVSGRFPLDLEETKELCKISFKIKKADSQEDAAGAFLLMLCDKLEPVTTMVAQIAETLSAEDASKAIVDHLHDLPIPATVQLGSASIAFGGLMDLAPNDIIVLDNKVTDPIKLLIDKMELLDGQLAKCDGNYAVAITGASPDNTN